jgi:HAD superfamily hydrolase (TIGR01509 family)
VSRIEAVILDIDGTLLDSNDAHARAFLESAEALGIPAPHLDRIRGLIGMGGDKLIPAAFGIEAESESDLGAALDERKGAIFRTRHAPALMPTPGARELLERFRADGLRRVVATSAGEEDLAMLLGRAGVADLIDDCTSSSDVEGSKPDPDLVHVALRLARVPADRAVMLGDTPYDVEAALKAGVRILAVRCGGWSDAPLAGATAVYDHPADLLAKYESSIFAVPS